MHLSVGDADSALLAMPRRELVADLRHANCARAHFDELGVLVGRRRDHHLVDDAVLLHLEPRAAVALRLLLRPEATDRVPLKL